MKKSILGFIMTATIFLATAQASLISHKADKFNKTLLTKIEAKIRNTSKSSIPVEQQITWLHELAEFELGQFLLTQKGLNGFWTAYCIIHGPKKTGLSELEHWILNNAPVVKATQERFGIFKEKLQKYLGSNMTLASVPCGTMDDLLGLDYTEIENTKLVGIDLDPESITFAQGNAEQYPSVTCTFHQQDAWSLDTKAKFDILTSNGLNIYEPDDAKVTELYAQFHGALKPGGILITSFLTPPPALSPESTWCDVTPADALKQKTIFADIIGAGWQAFRTEATMRTHLESVGFKVLEVIYDTQGIFPTIIAQK